MAEGEGGGKVGLGEGQATRRERDPGVVVRPARASEIPAILALWREADAVPSVSDDPAVALWRAAGYAHDPRIGRFVRSLR